MSTHAKARSLFDPAIVRGALVDSFRKLDPRIQVRNPVMFVVAGRQRPHHGALRPGPPRQGRGARLVHLRRLAVALVHGAVRELRRGDGRGPRQGAGREPQRRRGATSPPRSSPTRPVASSIPDRPGTRTRRARSCARATSCSSRRATSSRATARSSRAIASVDESAITGESAPVIREAGGDRSAVTGGTRVLSDWIVVRITREPGRDLPRPHDRDGRGRQAAEDAERDRAQHPARRR